MPSLSLEKKLVWLGMRNPQQSISQIQTEIQKLKDNVGEFAEFQADLDDENIGSYADFKAYLESNGFSSDEADAFIEKIKNNFDSYADFETFVEGASSYMELKAEFGAGVGFSSGKLTEDGGAAAGIEIHDQPAISRDGVSVEAGTIEIYGRRVEFSQTNSIQTLSPTFDYSNLTVSDTSPTRFSSISISADITNNSTVSGMAYPQLKIDGEVVSGDQLYITSTSTESVSFTYTFNELVQVDVAIGDTTPITVSVEPTTLGGP